MAQVAVATFKFNNSLSFYKPIHHFHTPSFFSVPPTFNIKNSPNITYPRLSHHSLFNLPSPSLTLCNNNNKSGTFLLCIGWGILSNTLPACFARLKNNFSRLFDIWLLFLIGFLDMISQLEVAKPELNKREPEKRVNGIFWIILLNIGIFVADHFFRVHYSLPIN